MDKWDEFAVADAPASSEKWSEFVVSDETKPAASSMGSAPTKTVFSDTRGKAYAVDARMNNGRAIEQQIGLQHESRKKTEYFGLLDLGKGFLSFSASTAPEVMASGLRERADLSKQFSIENFVPLWGEAKRLFRDVSPVVGVPEASQALGFNIGSALAGNTKTSLADAQLEASKNIRGYLDSFLAKADLKLDPNASAFSEWMYKFGQGAGSLAASLGLLYATKNPAAAAQTFALIQKGNIYEEARNKGFSPLAASSTSSIAGMIEGALEGLGGFAWMKAASVNQVLRRTFYSSMTEAIQEAAQTFGEAAVTNLAGMREDSLLDIAGQMAEAASMGFLLGGGASAIQYTAEKNGLKDKLRATGMNDAQVERLINIASEKTMENGSFQKEVFRIVTDELSVESATEAERLQGLRELQRQMDEYQPLIQLDFENELGVDAVNEQIAKETQRVDEFVQRRMNDLVATTKDVKLQGRMKELVSESDRILGEIDALEIQKGKLEEENKSVAGLDKKINSLVKKYEAVEVQLADNLGENTYLTPKLEKQRVLRRIGILTTRASKLSDSIKLLQEEKTRQEKLIETTEIGNKKQVEKIDTKLNEYIDQYNRIDEELANLMIDRDIAGIKSDSTLKLRGKEFDKIVKGIGKQMERIRERMAKAAMDLEVRIDKEVKKHGDKVARIARQKERQHIKQALSIIRQIKTANIKNMTVQERKEIERLQTKIKEVQKNARVNKLDVVQQLRGLNDLIQMIKEEGKRKLETILEARTERRDMQKEVLLLALGVDVNAPQSAESKGPSIGSEAQALAEKKAAIKKLPAAERALSLMPMRVLEMIDGTNNGAWKDIFYNKINRLFNQKLLAEAHAEGVAMGILRDAGLTAKDLAAKLSFSANGRTETFTIDKVMHMYAAMNNDLNLLALIHDNDIPLEIIMGLTAQLSDKQKTAAELLAQELSKHFPRLLTATLDYTDGKQDLVKVEGAYIPMYREMAETDQMDTADELMELMNERADFQKAFVKQGFKYERVRRGEKAKLRPLQLGLTQVYFKHVKQREHFIALGRAVKDLQSLLSDKDISKALTDKYGDAMFNSLQGYINAVANPGFFKATKGMDRVNRIINRFGRFSREAASFVHLGWNIISAAKAGLSMSAAMGRVSFPHLTSANWQAMVKHDETYAFVLNRDPQLASAEPTRELREFKDLTKNENVVAKHAFDWIRFFDRYTRVVVWKGAYDQAIEQGLGEETAIERAQEAVLATQPATDVKDLPQLYRSGNEMFNLFLQFTHQLNQNYGILTHDMPRAWKGGRKKAAFAMFSGLLFQALAEYAISHGDWPDDIDDWKAAFMSSFAGSIPFFGPILNAHSNGFEMSLAGLEVTTTKPLKAVGALLEGDVAKALDNALYFGATFAKLPYTQIRRTVSGFYDLATDQTDDWMRIFMSEYSRRRAYEDAE